MKKDVDKQQQGFDKRGSPPEKDLDDHKYQGKRKGDANVPWKMGHCLFFFSSVFKHSCFILIRLTSKTIWHCLPLYITACNLMFAILFNCAQ